MEKKSLESFVTDMKGKRDPFAPKVVLSTPFAKRRFREKSFLASTHFSKCHFCEKSN
jgi:hypothetical protein